MFIQCLTLTACLVALGKLKVRQNIVFTSIIIGNLRCLNTPWITKIIKRLIYLQRTKKNYHWICPLRTVKSGHRVARVSAKGTTAVIPRFWNGKRQRKRTRLWSWWRDAAAAPMRIAPAVSHRDAAPPSRPTRRTRRRRRRKPTSTSHYSSRMKTETRNHSRY